MSSVVFVLMVCTALGDDHSENGRTIAIHQLAMMYFLYIFLHHDVRMYDIVWAYLVPEINE